ncbi:MAG: ABC transporter ATP-binding protein [Hungatella hathewayi]|uniref:ABC transporter ATP-binding protein n=1 Tax=Hungatella TaxID=1649459 RepID=UPI001107568C|nr:MULTISPECIES: ABC transporter ATP-binding protein [Hungatella]MCI7382737.1 ABC transporter ATP-binding protein [Hungatella sp.]MCQ5385622.1 ABC transporter ATP-binding protein [Hungatella hathewayi]MDY6236568.1 ABC transporter ATP-binding protein [Hungatella hathewayi]
MSNIAIKVNDISMMFNKSSEKIDSLKEYMIKLVKRQLMFEEFWALQNISFEIKKGEAVGIVGLNGSGKSTLLKTIAKVLKPTKGEVEVVGTIAPLIELGAGFDSNLSARENIFLNGAVLGYNRMQMREKFESIMDFAELWDFVDVPIKNFSSGMVARLGFSIATSNMPDILIVDEILGVGDYKFQRKCEERMSKIIDNGATIVFVSHSIEQVREVCSRAIWLEKGHMLMDGSVDEVCDKYSES